MRIIRDKAAELRGDIIRRRNAVTGDVDKVMTSLAMIGPQLENRYDGLSNQFERDLNSVPLALDSIEHEAGNACDRIAGEVGTWKYRHKRSEEDQAEVEEKMIELYETIASERQRIEEDVQKTKDKFVKPLERSGRLVKKVIEIGRTDVALIEEATKAAQAGLAAIIDPIETAMNETFASLEVELAEKLKPVREGAADARALVDEQLGNLGDEAKKVEDAVKEAMELLMERVSVPLGIALSEFESATEQLKQIIYTLKTWLMQTISPLAAELKELQKTTKRSLDGVMDTFDSLKNAILDAIRMVKDGIVKTVFTMFDAAKLQADGFMEGVETMEKTVVTVIDKIKALIKTIVDAIRTLVSDGLGAIRTLQDSASALIKAFFDALDEVKKTIAAFKDTIMAGFEAVKSAIAQLASLFEEIMATFKGLLGTITEVLGAIQAEGLPTMLVSPALSAIQAAVDQVTPQIATAAEQGASSFASLSSQIGTQIQGISKGAKSSTGTFTSSSTGALDQMLPPLKESLGSIATQVGAVVKTAVKAVKKQRSGGKDQVGGMKGSLTDQVDTFCTNATTPIDQAQSQITAKIDDAREEVKKVKSQILEKTGAARTKVSNAITPIKTTVGDTLAKVRAQIKEAQEKIDGIDAKVQAPFGKLSRAVNGQVATGRAKVTQVKGELLTKVGNAKAKVSKVIATVKQKVTGIVDQGKITLKQIEAEINSQLDKVKNEVFKKVDDAIAPVRKELQEHDLAVKAKKDEILTLLDEKIDGLPMGSPLEKEIKVYHDYIMNQVEILRRRIEADMLST